MTDAGYRIISRGRVQMWSQSGEKKQFQSRSPLDYYWCDGIVILRVLWRRDVTDDVESLCNKYGVFM